EEKLERMLEDPSLRRVEEDISRLTVRNQRDIDEAEARVANIGTSDDFEVELGSLLETAFRAWDDGGVIEPLGSNLVRVEVPARLRRRGRTDGGGAARRCRGRSGRQHRRLSG